MDQRLIKRSKETGELQLTAGDKFSHYGIVVYLLIIPSTLIFVILKDLVLKGSANLRTEFVWIIVIAGALSFLFYRLQKKRLKLTKVDTCLTKEEIETVVEKVADELKWYPHLIDEEIIIAKTQPGFWSGSWGEQITIIFDSGRIWINSICDPDKMSSVTSNGRNDKNLKIQRWTSLKSNRSPQAD